MAARDVSALPDDTLMAAVGGMLAAVEPPAPIDTAALTYDWRALTLRQPWATWVALKAKPTENRTRKTDRRGPVLIHAGLGFDEDAWHRVGVPRKLPLLHSLPAGAIVAVASITDCHEAAGCCAPWGEAGPGVWHWVLDDVRGLPQPVPARGALGFWRPDADTLAAVLKQIGAAR